MEVDTVRMSANSPLLQSLVLLALIGSAQAMRTTAQEETESNGWQFVAFLWAVLMAGFVPGMMMGRRRRGGAAAEAEPEAETQPDFPFKDASTQTQEQVITVEREVEVVSAPEAVWVCKVSGGAFHKAECRCLWVMGTYRGTRMTRCRVCHSGDRR